MCDFSGIRESRDTQLRLILIAEEILIIFVAMEVERTVALFSRATPTAPLANFSPSDTSRANG
jgi:hypothetical protein